MISIDSTRCVGCGLCVADCIQKNLFLQNGRAEARGDCFLCGHCAAICPQNAVSIPEYREDSTVEYRPETFDLPVENLLNTIKFRRSIRAYKSDPIEYEKLSLLAQAGRHAATAKNTQRCRFVFVQKELDIFKSIFWDAVREAISSKRTPASSDCSNTFMTAETTFRGRNICSATPRSSCLLEQTTPSTQAWPRNVWS